MPACDYWPGLSAYGYSASVRPAACDPTEETAISRARPAHASEQAGTHYTEGNLLMDSQTIPYKNNEALAQRCAAWNTMLNRQGSK